MSAVERNILSILEPTIVLDELKITDVESGTANSGGDAIKEPPSKFLNIIPQIRINQYDIGDGRLESFTLDCTGFYPTCRFTFYSILHRGGGSIKILPTVSTIFFYPRVM